MFYELFCAVEDALLLERMNIVAEEKMKKKTSFDDKALLVKSLQQVLKHFSTRLEYIFRKSCICLFKNRARKSSYASAYLSLFDDLCHMGLFCGIEI